MTSRRTTLIIIILLGAWLRFCALFADVRFHPDEALFATFARAAATNGDWLLPGTLDKTPLSIYAQAVAMMPFMTESDQLLWLDWRLGEIAARLPSMLASVLLIPIMYQLARITCATDRGSKPAVVEAQFAALLMALSPFAVAFSATAFTDGLLLLFVTLSLSAVVADRPLLGGLWLALGFASKQQAVLLVPLLLLLLWGLHGLTLRRLWRLGAPLVAMLVVLLVWDAARAQESGVFALAASNNDVWRFIRASEIVPRLQVWMMHGRWLIGAGWLTMLLVGLALVALVDHIRRGSLFRANLVDVLLLTYILAYVLLHWSVAFNTYDRYLLLILPALILLAARGFSWVQSQLRLSVFGSILLLVGALLPTAHLASTGRLGIAVDRDAGEEIDQLAAYLNERALGAIIYDYWLGWELDYYLGQWTDKRRVFYPTPHLLVVDAVHQPDPALRYLVMPRRHLARPWLEALCAADFELTEPEQVGQFIVYPLVPPSEHISPRQKVGDGDLCAAFPS